VTGAGGYDAFADPYVYSGTDVLKNRLRTRGAAVLAAFELEMTVQRSSERFPVGRFDALHYRRLHRHLFQDVYEWAGRYRSIRIGKGGNWFCFPEHIDASMRRLFQEQRDVFMPRDGFDDFIRRAALFLGELNAIHPFRDGNGRTQLLFMFMHLVAIRAGHPLAFERVRQTTFLPAMIASFDGNLTPLERELAGLRV